MFVTYGVDTPIRDIVPAAGAGMGTIYRHFPTRADLVIAVYRHQVDVCAEAGPALLANQQHSARRVGAMDQPLRRLPRHQARLAAALQSDNARFESLHVYFLDRLVPVCAQLLDAAAEAGEIRPDVDAYGLLHGIGNLCVGIDHDPRYDARRVVELLVAGLRESRPTDGTASKPAQRRSARN